MFQNSTHSHSNSGTNISLFSAQRHKGTFCSPARGNTCERSYTHVAYDTPMNSCLEDVSPEGHDRQIGTQRHADPQRRNAPAGVMCLRASARAEVRTGTVMPA